MIHEVVTAALVVLHLFMWWSLLQDEENRERLINTIVSLLFFVFEKAGDLVVFGLSKVWGVATSALAKVFTKRR